MNFSPIFHRDPADSFFTDNYDEVKELEPCTCPECGSSCTGGGEDEIVTCDNNGCGLWWVSREEWEVEAAEARGRAKGLLA